MDKLDGIVNYLILNYGQINDVSLYHGKTGVILALMMYAKSTDCTPVKDFADECFLEIYDGIHDGMPIGIEYGLAGIGYGVTLMKKAGLIDCDLNDVLFNIDYKIMETDPRRCKNLSFRKGLAGVMSYINLRMAVEGQVLSFDSMYLNELAMRMSSVGESIHTEVSKTMIDDIDAPSWKDNDYISKLTSIHNGSAYYLIKSVYDKVLSNK